MKTLDMEIALIPYFKPRRNLVVPNIGWGMKLHECDLLVVTSTGCAYEVEIKISRADLVKDGKKVHGHRSSKIKYLYFAIPDELVSHIEYIPARAGIIVVSDKGKCRLRRRPKVNSKYKFTAAEKYGVARLGAMRILGLKKKIKNLGG